MINKTNDDAKKYICIFYVCIYEFIYILHYYCYYYYNRPITVHICMYIYVYIWIYTYVCIYVYKLYYTYYYYTTWYEVVAFLMTSFSHSHVWFFLLSWPFPVPPIIEPFNFQEGLSEGMRTRTVCGVAAGDPPLTISWLKDGHSLVPLSPKLATATNVSQLDSYSSLLSITNLTAEHSGDFTCVAANPAAEVRYTAKLQVKGN